MQWHCPQRFLHLVSNQAWGAVALVACLLLIPQARAQTSLPASADVFAPEPQPVPIRPLPYSPFGYYDLLAGFRPVYLGAPQPTGHQIIATSSNGYIYRPVYDQPLGSPIPIASPATPAQQAAKAFPASSPPDLQPPRTSEIQSAIQDFQAGRYDATLNRLQQLTAIEARNGFAWLLTSHAEFALHRFSDASISLRRALAVLPENQWGQILLQYRDFYRTTRYTTHLRALETFVAVRPSEATAHLLLGYHYGFLGYRAPAVEQLQLATTDDVDRRLLSHFGGRPGLSPPAASLPLAPPPAPKRWSRPRAPASRASSEASSMTTATSRECRSCGLG